MNAAKVQYFDNPCAGKKYDQPNKKIFFQQTPAQELPWKKKGLYKHIDIAVNGIGMAFFNNDNAECFIQDPQPGANNKIVSALFFPEK